MATDTIERPVKPERSPDPDLRSWRHLKAWLDAGPQVDTIIAPDPWDKHGERTKVWIGYHGFNFEFYKGEPIKVGKPLAEIIEEHNRRVREHYSLALRPGDTLGPQVSLVE